ncbi:MULTISPECIES: hypothetical protein [Candidatus Nitrosocaldus]|jgi:hypothetical protein|uniref:Uncharacterized protein n=1 Tax=Candidatus Nitrosocaldus cavascurensis TaxID=2058097 RepID=A0A2K5ANZ1_9ARCH|nr:MULTISPECIES: hypothetical protein [Candidatus Nitrosocaldus]SPC33355.1 conserved protein of unknown function [Candidatus Nitrosocaldus cavascurensis]
MYSDDEIKRFAMLREWVVKQIEEKEEELERLREMLAVVDNMLKQVSFKPAGMLQKEERVGVEMGVGGEAKPIERSVEEVKEVVSSKAVEGEYTEVRQLKTKDGVLLANAYIASDAISIVPASDVRLNVNTPPFQSFFINRILKEMKGRDEERVRKGEIRGEQVLDYSIDLDEGKNIKRILIRNYRDKDRLNELINSSTWVLTRMLEKVR